MLGGGIMSFQFGGAKVVEWLDLEFEDCITAGDNDMEWHLVAGCCGGGGIVGDEVILWRCSG
jgi:hypothetical protein